jgi:hypothetical protein
MFLKDTISPLLGYLMPFVLGMSFAEEGDEPTPLPEALTKDQDLATFKTVEDLATGYKDVSKKAASIGSIETIPEDIRKDPNISKYKTLEELAKGHLETIKLIGKKGVIIPGEGATQEEIDKFQIALGRPVKPEEYKFTPVENLHPDIKITPESENAYKGIAHKIGLSQAQADNLNKWFLETVSAGLTVQANLEETAMKEAETKLRQEWGANFDTNLALAKRLVDKFGGKEGTDAFGDLGNNPAVLKILASIGKKLSEDSIEHTGFSDLATSTQDAKKRIDIIEKEIMKMSQNDPEYPKLVKERMELYKIAYPEERAE